MTAFGGYLGHGAAAPGPRAALRFLHPPPAVRGTGGYGISAFSPPHSALIPVNFTTLPHFSVSSAMSLPKSAGESASTSPPRSARRALILGSARPALISLFSFSTISAGVALGAPTPHQALAS